MIVAGAHGRLRTVEILERADLLGGGRRDDETKGTLRPARMGRRENHGLGNASFILSEDVHQIAEMPVKAARTHGGTKFESRLERNHLNVKPSGIEQLLVGRSVDHNGVGGWKHARCRRGSASTVAETIVPAASRAAHKVFFKMSSLGKS